MFRERPVTALDQAELPERSVLCPHAIVIPTVIECVCVCVALVVELIEVSNFRSTRLFNSVPSPWWKSGGWGLMFDRNGSYYRVEWIMHSLGERS